VEVGVIPGIDGSNGLLETAVGTDTAPTDDCEYDNPAESDKELRFDTGKPVDPFKLPETNRLSPVGPWDRVSEREPWNDPVANPPIIVFNDDVTIVVSEVEAPVAA
jgi:hypothetical protein